MQSEILIEKLLEQTRLFINQAEQLKTNDLHTLTWRENETSWNILECLEHLNLYGNYYLPQIDTKIKNAICKSEFDFKSGLLGNYFAKSMLPKEKLNRIKTFKDKNPLNKHLNTTVIDQFIAQQINLMDLLNRSKNVSLNKVKIETSISNLIKIKLGDTFHFFINHIIRHLKQIDCIQEKMKKS